MLTKKKKQDNINMQGILAFFKEAITQDFFLNQLQRKDYTRALLMILFITAKVAGLSLQLLITPVENMT